MHLTMSVRHLALPVALGTLLTVAGAGAPALAEETAAAATQKSAQAAPAKRGVVNVNSATAAELARLPRVGAKLADRIVAHRGQHGPFKRVEDLMEVKGVGEKMFAFLKPYLATSGSTTLAAKVSSAGTRSGSPASRRASGKTPARSAPKSPAAPAAR